MTFSSPHFRPDRKVNKGFPAVKRALLIMKFINIFIFVACLQVFAETYAQPVNLSLKNVPFQKVLKEIKKQTGFNFICTTELLDLIGNVSVEGKNLTLQTALQECLQKSPLTYTIIENTIIIKQKPLVEDVANLKKEIPMADVVLKGVVTDESGLPLEGASISVKGTGTGVSADAKGAFSIVVPDNSSMVLIVSFVGMENREINVKGMTSVKVSLKKMDMAQQEVIVVGYGSQRKATVTGAVAQIGSKALQSAPAPNTSQLLVGRLPGLIAKTESALPGQDNANLQIRGYGNALIIVDGLPTPFNRIDPNDIESISILKDASAAIYGARAGNGVILVTTKRGKTGAPQINYTSTFTYQMPSAFQNTVNAGD